MNTPDPSEAERWRLVYEWLPRKPMPPQPLHTSTCSEICCLAWSAECVFASSGIWTDSYGSRTASPPKQTRLGLWKKLGVLWFKLTDPFWVGCSICWLDECRASQDSTIIFLRSLWTQRSKVRSSAQWLLILGMYLSICVYISDEDHMKDTWEMIAYLHVSLSAAWTHSLNSSGVGFLIKLNMALHKDRWLAQGIREISVSRPSYSWVKNWVPMFRLVSHNGAILLPPQRSNTFRRYPRS